ncbi:hypothetical protein CVT24_006670, partial [Panaeolus cyanescens]
MDTVADFIEDLRELPYLPSQHDPSLDEYAIGQEGPGPQTAANRIRRQVQALLLDDNNDERVVLVDKGAGHIVRYTTPPRLLSVSPNRSGYDEDGDQQMDSDSEGQSEAEREAQTELYAPFKSRMDWEVARWAIKTDPGKNGLDRLLQIPGVREGLDLSFDSSYQLWKILDRIPERAGDWETKTLKFSEDDGDSFIIRHRNPVEAIKSLWSDPILSPNMTFAPIKLYTDKSRRHRIYSEMWTGQWWSSLQARQFLIDLSNVDPHATQLTLFIGGKAAYPVYLTIGNIPRGTRRKPSAGACVLIAYLSVDKIKEIPGERDTERRAKVQKVFHEAMRIVLEPLIEAGRNGVEMTSSDG